MWNLREVFFKIYGTSLENSYVVLLSGEILKTKLNYIFFSNLIVTFVSSIYVKKKNNVLPLNWKHCSLVYLSLCFES